MSLTDFLSILKPCIPVSRRCKPRFFFKDRIEIIRIGEAGGFGDGRDGHVAVHQQFLGFYDAKLADVVVDVKAGDGFENPGKVVGGIA